MSYQYTTGVPGTQQPTTATYPYGAYPQSYSQITPGAYAYSASAYPSGVTGYYAYHHYNYTPSMYTARSQVPTPTGTPAPSLSYTANTAAKTASTPATASTISTQPQRTATYSAYSPSVARETVAAASSGGATGRGSRKASTRGLFIKELKNIMYGFGDDRNPSNDTAYVLEEILVEYITDVCLTAGGPSRKGRLSIEDLRRALSHPADAKKLARMEELLFMQEDIKRARAQFNDEDINRTKAF